MTGDARFAITLFGGAVLAFCVLVTASAQSQASPKYGGTLVVGLGRGEPDALDPTLSLQFSALEVYRTFCEKLYDQDSKANIVPQLATALPVVSRDKLTYTIRLRKGISFNDGTPFNAQAVVTTLQRNLTHDGSVRSSDLESVDSVTASGPDTVVLHLKSPSAPLTLVLSTPAAAIMSPAQLAKLGDRFATNPICVGPFIYDNRVAGDSITVIKSHYYYDQKDVHLDKIVFKVANDPAAAAAALKAGDLQALDGVSTTERDGLARSSSLRLLEQNSFGFQDVRINIGNRNGVGNLPYSNVGTPLASSARLRKAFEEAIDRKALARVVFGGSAQPGCTAVSPASPWFDESLQCTPYDPADARKLVAASGMANPTVHLLTVATSEQLRLAQFIQTEEAAVGITVLIDTTDAATAATTALSGNFDAYLGSWAGRSDPDQNIFVFLATSGSRNYSGYSNPRLDLILDNGRKATTPQARKTLYRVAQQIILADRPSIYLYHAIRFVGVSRQVTGVQLYPDTALRVAFAQFR